MNEPLLLLPGMMRDLVSGARLAVIREAGHCQYWNNPNELTKNSSNG
jgi:hypothetical protein